MRALVTGWFSFEEMGATAGDLDARDVVCEWLRAAGMQYDVSLASPFVGGVDWREVDPGDYSHLVFVCGPFGNGEPVTELLERFRGKKLVGVNLTMLQPLDEWNPFDLLLERDSSGEARPDLAFLAETPRVPIVGLVLREHTSEYRGRHRYDEAAALIDALLASRELAVVRIDTRLDENTTGLRTAREIESLIARVDVVVTTRLHGLVLALKNGVPVVAVDSISGGGKITRQAEVVGWPVLLAIDSATAERAREALDFCLTPAAQEKARACAAGAVASLAPTRERFVGALAGRPVAPGA